jgi:hypothetical protein
MCGKDDKIACNVGGERAAKEPGRPAFNYLRHVPNRALRSDALEEINAWRTARSRRLFSDILVKQKRTDPFACNTHSDPHDGVDNAQQRLLPSV